MNHEFDEVAGNLPRYELSAAAQDQHLRMIAGLTSAPAPTPVLKRRWVLILAAVVGLSGAGVGTAAALGFFSAPPTDRRIAHCYSTEIIDDPARRLDVTVAQTADGSLPSLHDAATSALDICGGAWNEGRLSITDPIVKLDPLPTPSGQPTPPLVACVLESGEVGVFPGQSDLCNRIGLANAEL